MEHESLSKTRYLHYQKILQHVPSLYSPLCKMELDEKDPIAIVTGSVLAPTLAGFVRWLLVQAKKEGIQRLYFLARDGYFPCRAAQIFCERYHIPMECRYLSVSRYSLRLPLFHLDLQAALQDICRSAVHVTVSTLLKRAGIRQEEHRKVLHALSLPYQEHQSLSKTDLAAIRRKMEHCPVFLDAVERASKEAFPALMGYLRQEGLFEEVPYAIVDSGWLGSMQKSLQTLLHLVKRRTKLIGHYWGIYRIPTGMNRENYRCYFFEPEHHIKEKVYFNNCVYEAVFSAPHGTTTGYRIENGKFLPVYGKCPQRQIEFLRQTEKLYSSYLHGLAEQTPLPVSEAECMQERETIRKLLSLFMCCPSRAEAAAFGSLPFSDDVLEGDEHPLAAHLTEQQLRAGHIRTKVLALTGRSNRPHRESAWYEASAILYSNHAKRHLRQYTLYKYLRHMRKPQRRTERRNPDG